MMTVMNQQLTHVFVVHSGLNMEHNGCQMSDLLRRIESQAMKDTIASQEGEPKHKCKRWVHSLHCTAALHFLALHCAAL